MVERGPVRLSSNVTRLSPPPVAKQSGGGGWIVIGLIVAAVVGLSKCSSDGSGSGTFSSSSAVVGNAQQALVSAVTAQTPPPVRELSTTSLRRGASRVSIASKEGLAGELIYSQNCYDALGRGFTWNKLDECGGFDVEASLTLADDEPVGSEKEVAWFDGEAAAGRYLKAAVAAGQDADAADSRFANLQKRVARRRSQAKPRSSSAEDEASPTIDNTAPAENPEDVAQG